MEDDGMEGRNLLLSWFLAITAFMVFAGIGTFFLWSLIKASISDVVTQYVMMTSYLLFVAIICFLVLQPALYRSFSAPEEEQIVKQDDDSERSSDIPDRRAPIGGGA